MRKCLDCPVSLESYHHSQKRCPPCSAAHRRAYHTSWQRKAEGRAMPPLPRKGRFIYHADFLLLLPELRAELNRVTQGQQSIDVRGVSPLELPVLGSQRGTGRSG